MCTAYRLPWYQDLHFGTHAKIPRTTEVRCADIGHRGQSQVHSTQAITSWLGVWLVSSPLPCAVIVHRCVDSEGPVRGFNVTAHAVKKTTLACSWGGSPWRTCRR
eukprot:5979799-Prymnesium_polylepis.1